jgi:hypothetical protein
MLVGTMFGRLAATFAYCDHEVAALLKTVFNL